MESESTTTKSNGSGRTTPPAKPGSNSSDSTESGEMPAMPEDFDGEMPEMCDSDDEDCEMPEMPGDMQGGPGGDGNFPGEMTMESGSSDSILHPVAYLALGGVSVIISMVIMYTCFSKFFHKKPGQTFDKGSKFAWYLVGSIVLAAGLIALCYFVPTWVS